MATNNNDVTNARKSQISLKPQIANSHKTQIAISQKSLIAKKSQIAEEIAVAAQSQTVF